MEYDIVKVGDPRRIISLFIREQSVGANIFEGLIKDWTPSSQDEYWKVGVLNELEKWSSTGRIQPDTAKLIIFGLGNFMRWQEGAQKSLIRETLLLDGKPPFEPPLLLSTLEAMKVKDRMLYFYFIDSIHSLPQCGEKIKLGLKLYPDNYRDTEKGEHIEIGLKLADDMNSDLLQNSLKKLQQRLSTVIKPDDIGIKTYPGNLQLLIVTAKKEQLWDVFVPFYLESVNLAWHRLVSQPDIGQFVKHLYVTLFESGKPYHGVKTPFNTILSIVDKGI